MTGLVAGACAGFSAVLLDAVAAAWQTLGRDAVTDPGAVVAALLLVPVATAGLVLLQSAFQVDALGASYPADLVANPCTAVLLGAVLLHEDVPHSRTDLALFVACLAAIAFGAFSLATRRPVATVDGAPTAP
ncbi:hypothetical protein KZZ52_28525 [Dactylosporangium sp. AC04546]|uniref:hypothetical protein n=1 Tax=Dactylosporangium sp. AC04546 TaxID=2862460 RepID=UPI001EE06FB6|nr:hypothetical protein [Dactylosporangium sp. AC04546]WVK89215.1 hypothetical protein KZZ52_28525 [Dactylosporangium sp. AC04546]